MEFPPFFRISPYQHGKTQAESIKGYDFQEPNIPFQVPT